jgi:hypothetical protein
MTFDEHHQADMMHDGHQPGVRLADSQGAAGAIEPQVMSQQNADRLRVQMLYASEVDDDMAGRRLVELGTQVFTEKFDRLVISEVGQKGRDHQDVLDHLVLDAWLGILISRVAYRERFGWLGISGIRSSHGAVAVEPAGDHFVDLARLGTRRTNRDSGDDRAHLDPVAFLERNLFAMQRPAVEKSSVGAAEILEHDAAAVAPFNGRVEFTYAGRA